METKAKIRHRYHVKKETVSVIARTMGLSRNTVRKIVNQGDLANKYAREVQPAPKLGEYKEVLLAWLNEDKKYPVSARCTDRKQLFTPRCKSVDLETLNQKLLLDCHRQACSRVHPNQKELTVFEVFEAQEKAPLRVTTRPFDGYYERIVKVSSTCLVQYDRNRYSVDCHYANCRVSLRVYALWIEIVGDGEVIGRRKRLFGRDKTQFNPLHYFPVLERKPGAGKKTWRTT